MNPNIERGGKWVRPSFNHYQSVDGATHEAVAAQMLESIRNLLESCQMLQCDVARAIKEIPKELRGLRRDLKKKKRRRK